MLNPYLERQRLNIVCVTIVFNVLAMGLLSRSSWSDWKAASALFLFDNALLCAHAFRMRDLMMLRLMFFGLVLGIANLGTCLWLAEATGTVDYSPGGGPMLWSAPVWMPLAWQMLAVQFGYIGVRLYETMGWQGLPVNGVLGAVALPAYDELAFHVHWWRYQHCHMIGSSHMPWYAIGVGFLAAFCIGRLATCIRQRSWQRVFVMGVLGAVAILASYSVSYLLTDRVWTLFHN